LKRGDRIVTNCDKCGFEEAIVLEYYPLDIPHGEDTMYLEVKCVVCNGIMSSTSCEL